MENIEAIWDKGNEQISKDESLDSAFIEKSISESSTRITSKLIKAIKLGLILTLLSVIMFVYNAFFYLNNTPILISIIILILLSLCSIIYLFIQAKKIKREDITSTNLHKLLVNKIKFFTTHFQVVIQCLAASIVLLTITLNLTMENGDGIFELRKILILSVYYILVYAGLVFLFKKLNNINLKRLRIALFNLEENSLNTIDTEEKKHKNISRLILVIVLVLLILGLIAALFKNFI